MYYICGVALIDDLLARLRTSGGDTTDIEVKSASGGLSPSLFGTMCGLANLPGGGTIVLGLDESAGFAPVPLGDLQVLRQGLAGKARACSPPVQLTFHDAQVQGQPVIVAQVAECAPSAKPCRVTSSGVAWVRLWDGDFTMSPLEEQAFLAQREQPRFDQAPVLGATTDDLDPQLVAVWSQTVAERDTEGLGRFTGRELLFRAGILTADGAPTRAGLLALGVHPQQFFPRYVVNLAVTSQEPGVRAVEPATLSGSIPVILDGAMDWARRVFTNQVLQRPDGSLHDAWTYPLEAFRELVGNALVHRDLDAWSEGVAVEVRLTADRLVVTNPGGLYGVTVDRLGRQGVTSARNGLLVEICRYARSKDGARVVETLASGIPRVIETLAEEGHPAPTFQDSGIRFTVVLQPRGVASTSSPGTPSKARVRAGLGSSERRVLESMGAGEVTVAELESHTGLKAPNIRRVLRALAGLELVEQRGGRGQRTTYQVKP